jgi:SAM-dependent methyltransferase
VLLPTSGTALDVACGLGAQTLWLAERGLRIVALDVSPVAIAAITDAAAAAGLSHRVSAAVIDLDAGLPTEPGTVDVLVCQRFRQPALYAEFVERLAPGGVGIVTVLCEVGADSPGTFHAPSGELTAAFDRPGIDVLHHDERDGQATIVFRRC